jgi:ankyrin repeat protein
VVYLFLVAGLSAARAGAYEDFFKAIELDNAQAVTQLLGRGFDPNTPDPKGQLPLYLALRSESFQAAAALASSPAIQIDKANAAGETPLMIAAMRGSLDWTRRLVERGAQVNREGWTPLHYAASGPDPAVLAYLLDRGAIVDARAPNGSTALMMAASYGPEPSVRLLLERGADAKLRNMRDMSAADFARAGGREALATQLDQAARR